MWPYDQFPSPTVFTHLKKLHIACDVGGNQSALVAPEKTEVVFPF